MNRNLVDDTQEPIERLAATATHEAGVAMSRWTGGAVTLSLDEVREAPLEEIVAACAAGEEQMSIVALTLAGELGGVMLLMFDDVNGHRLAAALLGRAPVESETWSELEISALKETGNILACAYLNALTRTIGADLIPSPPTFMQDFGASVLEQSLMSQADAGDTAVICRTIFRREGNQLNWNVFFVPSPALRNALRETVNVASA